MLEKIVCEKQAIFFCWKSFVPSARPFPSGGFPPKLRSRL